MTVDFQVLLLIIAIFGFSDIILRNSYVYAFWRRCLPRTARCDFETFLSGHKFSNLVSTLLIHMRLQAACMHLTTLGGNAQGIPLHSQWLRAKGRTQQQP